MHLSFTLRAISYYANSQWIFKKKVIHYIDCDGDVDGVDVDNDYRDGGWVDDDNDDDVIPVVCNMSVMYLTLYITMSLF